ncbi:MAG: GspH/FimT family pseudopilin [Myxococcota bacterium]
MSGRKQTRGFSIVELVVTLSIVAIFVAFATPSLIGWSRTEKVKSGARDISLGLQRAKSFAVKRGNNVIMAFNSPANGSYQIVNDLNNNCVVNGGEAVLYSASLGQGVEMPAGTITFSSNNAAFETRGLPLGDAAGACLPFGTGGASGGGSVTVEMPNHNVKYVVTMALAGGITVQRQ